MIHFYLLSFNFYESDKKTCRFCIGRIVYVNITTVGKGKIKRFYEETKSISYYHEEEINVEIIKSLCIKKYIK